MASPLAHSKCFQHLSREAVARCPLCARFYCRECVTEHEGRMVCRSCLDDLLKDDAKVKRSFIQRIVSWMLAGIGFLTTTYAFYMLGRLLLRIPSHFHSGIFFD